MAIDILHLVDRLEKLLEQGRHLPFSSRVVVDEGLCLDIIDQMRISIPEEIRQAKRIQQERERIVAEAQDEGARIVAQAREDAARLLAEHELRRQAQQRAERMLAEAGRQARAIRQGADDYATEVLSQLIEELTAVQRTTANGLTDLERRRSRPRTTRATRQAEKPAADGTTGPTDAL